MAIESIESSLKSLSSRGVYITMQFTKYEKARVIGARAMQISCGAPPTVDIGDLDDAISIAKKEWNEGKIPMVLVRGYPNGEVDTINLDGRT